MNYLNVSENQSQRISIKYNEKLDPEKCLFEKNHKKCSIVVYADSIDKNEKLKGSATKFIQKLFDTRKIKSNYKYQLKC